MKSTDVGIIVARFQTPYLHPGHIHLINTVRDRHVRTIIFLGASPLKCSFANPLDIETRRRMINELYPDVEVHYIQDVGNIPLWSKKLDKDINLLIGPTKTAVLYGSRDSFLSGGYSNSRPMVYVDPVGDYDATQIRHQTGAIGQYTRSWREGVIWATQNQFPSVMTTVDMAIVDFKNSTLLVAKKPTDEKFRLIGGFTEPMSQSFEDDAIREVQEETGLTDVGGPFYIGSRLIPDWRYKGERNKIKTILYLIKYNSGVPIASDDICHVEWMPLTDLDENKFVNCHTGLISMTSHYLKANYPKLKSKLIFA